MSKEYYVFAHYFSTELDTPMFETFAEALTHYRALKAKYDGDKYFSGQIINDGGYDPLAKSQEGRTGLTEEELEQWEEER